MLDSLIVPLFVTTDLPPEADLAEFGELLAETARQLGHEDGGYDAFLAGKVFWLDQPVTSGDTPPGGAGPIAGDTPTDENSLASGGSPVGGGTPAGGVVPTSGAQAVGGSPTGEDELAEGVSAGGGEPRYAGMLGYLAASGAGHTTREVVGDVRQAIGAAVIERYGDVGVAPAVFAIRDQDVRERTPEEALYVDTPGAAAELVSATKSYL